MMMTEMHQAARMWSHVYVLARTTRLVSTQQGN